MLMVRANEASEKFFRSLVKQSFNIGGPFRGPGIRNEVAEIVERNLKKYLM